MPRGLLVLIVLAGILSASWRAEGAQAQPDGMPRLTAPVNDFAGVVGAPAAGYWLTWAGAIVLGLFARSVLRGGPSNGRAVR